MKVEELGKLIYEGRRRQGWDQAELAERLGNVVKQQAISGWERGASRPRRSVIARLAVVLQLDVAQLLEAAGYGDLADRPEESPERPVRPRLTTLPVWSLSPEQFEEFVTDVGQKRYPQAHVARMGSQGQKQYGVDVIAKVGAGYVATFQCKRHKEFGAAMVRKAIKELSLKADHHHLVLSRKSASALARREIEKHADWTLWDAEDLSRIVRNLPLEEAVRIVDTYFPGWREPLLGVLEPGPWLNRDEFFRPFTDLYRQDWQLVGREEELAAIHAFLRDDQPQLGFLVGRGGLGKTRLLREVAKQAEDRGFAVRFLKPGADLEPQHLELLPAGDQLLIIIDDAHDRDNLLGDVSELVRLRRPFKLLLSARPYGVESLRTNVSRLGLQLSTDATWVLSDLSKTDARALARQALGPDIPEHIAERLGAITADCPFITVIAGVLIRRGDLDPSCVDHEDTIRREALDKFREAVAADPSSDEPGLRKAVLDAVAVLQPFRTDDPQFQLSLANLTGFPYDRAFRHLRGLEDAGVLMRRGASLRVVPDLLGDLILTSACFDERSLTSTGYVERVWAAVQGEPAQHVFANTTRVDWQVHHDSEDAPSLTTLLWTAVLESVMEAGILGRIGILKLIAKVAFFEPGRSLEVVRWMIDNPTDEVEETDQPLLRLYAPTYDHVLSELSPILQAISYNFEYLPEAADLLWQLAQTDDRATNRFPDHPLRVLTRLAELTPGKPLPYHQAVVDAVERWLADLPPDYVGPSPLDVLEPILATEGTVDSVDGFQLQMRAITINPTVVAPLRNRVVDLALNEVQSSDVRRAVRATRLLEGAIRYPMGILSRQPTDEERDGWTEGFVSIIKRLGEVAAGGQLDPIVLVAIRRALFWHLAYTEADTKTAAEAAVELFPDTLEYRLAVGLFDGWGQLHERPDQDYHQAEAKKDARMRRLADELIAAYQVEQLIDVLGERLQKQERAQIDERGGFAGPFFWTLVRQQPSVGIGVCEQIIGHPDGPFLAILPTVLAALAEAAPGEVIARVRRLLALDSLSITRAVAQGLGWNRGDRTTLLDGELDVLRSFATHADVAVRNNMITAAQRLQASHPAEAMELICQVPFGDSEVLAEEFLQTFTSGGQFTWRRLSRPQAESIMGQLVECPSIDGYWITQFLAERSEDDPERVVELLIRRVEQWEANKAIMGYSALPFQWHHQLKVRATADSLRLLKRIRDWLAEKPDSWQRLDAGGRLFAAVAQDFDPEIVSLVEEALRIGTKNEASAAGAILRRSPQNFAFDHVEFVVRSLRAAKKFGDDTLRQVRGALSDATLSGGRSGTPGEPNPRDTSIQGRAKEIADGLPKGSVEEEFYRSLERSARESIRWMAEHDEKLLDGRDW